ncbi:MAG: SGNH/GDSL hydrolase family protein, partial [Lachnospiraceae bacterium]|nr:SGNH/GDSL hydrolase family protein [Lachnospiraceae bacterium]
EYTVTAYDESQVMYATGAVNVRKGPSTDFERVGGLAYGQEVTVTGQADTEWYEIVYGEEKAYVSNKYLQNDKPADESQAAAEADPQAEPEAQSQTQQAAPEIQPVTEVKNVAGVIFVGDSRFVQMQASVDANSCTWIAESAKGYTWFEEKAIPRIDGCVGSGSKILINLGVNDTRNLQKYITLVNAKAAEWTAAGATVYYASVNPVWENPYVTEEQVEYFNTQMQSGLSADVHWIDSHSYLTSVGYRLVDGLHYSTETYQTLYAYFMSCM